MTGGPLYDKENNVLVGIVSWGIGCADTFFPGVYSRVADQVSTRIIIEPFFMFHFFFPLSLFFKILTMLTKYYHVP